MTDGWPAIDGKGMTHQFVAAERAGDWVSKSAWRELFRHARAPLRPRSVHREWAVRWSTM
jgi:hypothetical protein